VIFKNDAQNNKNGAFNMSLTDLSKQNVAKNFSFN
jgi:hypothetical protein